MDCCIPVLPNESGVVFLIFRWGNSGYFPKPGGNSVSFAHRERDEMVPQLEIAKVLMFLGINPDDFWRVVDASEIVVGPQSKRDTKTASSD
jgi:hypothetical protein